MKRLFVVITFLFLYSNLLAQPEPEIYSRHYQWTYKGEEWSCTLQIGAASYHYYRDHRLHISDDFTRYILSDYDRTYLRDIVRSLREVGELNNFSDSDNVRNVVAFVQSLRYVSDESSKGQRDYVRYPLETLVDGEGDCEDTTVLIAAILYEMGYDFVLLLLPKHLALGVRGDESIQGAYYMVDGKRYYYLETTNVGWQLGDVPDEFVGIDASIIKVRPRPVVYIRSYDIRSVWMNDNEVTFSVSCRIENTGPSSTSNMRFCVMARSARGGRNSKGVERMVSLSDLTEGSESIGELLITVPRGDEVVFVLMLSGDNFELEPLFSKLIDIR